MFWKELIIAANMAMAAPAVSEPQTVRTPPQNPVVQQITMAQDDFSPFVSNHIESDSDFHHKIFNIPDAFSICSRTFSVKPCSKEGRGLITLYAIKHTRSAPAENTCSLRTIFMLKSAKPEVCPDFSGHTLLHTPDSDYAVFDAALWIHNKAEQSRHADTALPDKNAQTGRDRISGRNETLSVAISSQWHKTRITRQQKPALYPQIKPSTGFSFSRFT